MPASYREIDYRIRPGKYVERMMMIEAFRRLRFASVESYQYVGLGSVYFSDFMLVHRALGIHKLVSIERAVHDKNRFLGNIPFSSVEMLWGDTATELAKVDLSLRSIVWLDYDGRLSASMLNDITSVASRATSGSVLAVTVQCKFDRVAGEHGEDASVQTLVDALGADRIPYNLKTEDIEGQGTGRLFRKVIVEEVDRALSARNAILHKTHQFQARQVFNFRYEDGVPMMTVAVVIFDAGQRGLLDLCAFEALDFVRNGEEEFKIAIPKLTPREIKLLEAQMPNDDPSKIVLGPIPPKDAAQYTKLYRFFPNIAFVES
ncbi:hypothetical protein GCM10011321_25710 [Youhaiella tibetensis]|uniref:Uncharacterized protein n=1 Tax=Paradevosia tibetensis TaxID=1447062 RepID=A0A5B9DKF7_9HYPH|nr:O-methyltransferase [Youhaiella tibetensis]QEE19415.1 hypothetical protein FNA67_04155 [Youhaiella tibetensis]GGF33394.1 hypothetical protein GCM10011321_25710 [Youhaiella tibetensis]